MTDRGRAVNAGGPPPSLSAAGTAMDPYNVVPPIVYLASDAGGSITGRVIGATGNKIIMWREPQWEASIYYQEPTWDVDALFDIMPTTLGAGHWPKTPSHFP